MNPTSLGNIAWVIEVKSHAQHTEMILIPYRGTFYRLMSKIFTNHFSSKKKNPSYSLQIVLLPYIAIQGKNLNTSNRQTYLGLLGDFLKCQLIKYCQISQNFTVQFNSCFFQTIHENTV